MYSDSLVTFIASLKHCCKLVIQTCVYFFKAFHYYTEQCNKNIWFDGTLPTKVLYRNKVSVVAFVDAVFDDNMKVWNPTGVTKEHVLYEDSFCAHFVVGVSYAGQCVKIKSAYVICVICLFLMSVFFPLGVLQTFFKNSGSAFNVRMPETGVAFCCSLANNTSMHSRCYCLVQCRFSKLVLRKTCACKCTAHVYSMLPVRFPFMW